MLDETIHSDTFRRLTMIRINFHDRQEARRIDILGRDMEGAYTNVPNVRIYLTHRPVCLRPTASVHLVLSADMSLR